MVDLNLLSFFFFGFIFIQCEGKIIPPSGSPYFLPGSDATIGWSFDNVLTVDTIRDWLLVNNEGGANTLLARIIGAGSTPVKLLAGFAVEGKATLVIKNFDESKNGKYRFSITGEIPSDFVVSVIKKPTVTLSCTSPVSLKEGDNFACLCRGENGNPPPNVTWYKAGKQDGGIGKNNKTLELNNVNPQNDGTYTCKAESYPNEKFKDEKSIILTVKPYSKPSEPVITFTPPSPEIGSEVTITCTSDGHPEPSYTIKHDGKTISTTKTWKIPPVKKTDAGIYECFVENRFGNDSQSKNLTVQELQTKPTPTKSTMPSTSTASSGGGGTVKTNGGGGSGGISAGAIAGIVIGVLALIVIIVVVVYCCCCKSGKKDGHRGNRDVGPFGRNDKPYEMGEDGNAYDTVNPTGSGESSRGRGKPKKESQPAVYAQVDKENRQGKPLYATLDKVALDSKGSKKRDEDRAQPTEYAAIDHGRTADVPRADLV